MHHFQYKNGVLHAEDVSIEHLAKEVGTPFYCYSTATLEHHYAVLDQAFTDAGLETLICFAVKANSNQAVLKTMARAGAGMDVVSAGELHRALVAGVPAEKIVFSGVGKTDTEMAQAIESGILGFNVESAPELSALSGVATSLNKSARIAIRVNPDVDAGTHAKISTGKSENKFGVPYRDAPGLYDLARSLPGIDPAGIHMHIGSQITDLAPFRTAFALMRELAVSLRANGHAISYLDIGGGLGVPYRGTDDIPPSPTEYAAVARDELGDLGHKLILEPGRMIAANAGILVASVIYSKEGHDKTFTIVDAAMNDLIRPTLYDAHQEVWPVREEEEAMPPIIQDVVGPVCESGDYLAQDRRLPPFERGDRLALMSSGAYGAVMASTYNSRPLVPEILVNGAQWSIIRPRPTVETLLAADRLPDWFDAS